MPSSNKTANQVGHTDNGAGRTTPTPEIELPRVPPKPTYASDRDPELYHDQQVTRCEILMAQGIRDLDELQKLLDLPDPAELQGYIKRVKARWKVRGGEKNIADYRGEQIAKLRHLELEAWRECERSKLNTSIGGRSRGTGVEIDIRNFLRFSGLLLNIYDRMAVFLVNKWLFTI